MTPLTCPAKFCIDLFANVSSFQPSVIIDVFQDGRINKMRFTISLVLCFSKMTFFFSTTLTREYCFSDAPECTTDDFTAFYSECDDVTNLRSVYFDYVPESTCRGGHPLPDPIVNLNCRQECSPGYYLPLGETKCGECPAGSHR
jgi:hypothetical protein